MNGNELMIEADKLLQKWDLYDAKDKTEIKKIFDGSNRYDMLLNIDVFQKQAVLYILERGVRIFEYRTENREALIYFIIQDIIERAASTFIGITYADEKGHLSFSENIRKHKKEIVDKAFSLIGEPYNKWNKQGLTIWNVEEKAL